MLRILVGAIALVSAYFAAVLVIRLANLWLLIFGSVVFAAILRSIADPLVRRTRMKDGLATLVAVLLVVTAVGGVSTLFGQTISHQVATLIARIPAAWAALQAQLAAMPVTDQVLDLLTNVTGQAGRALMSAPKFATGFLSGVTTLVLVVVAGIYLALRPRDSREGVLVMAPMSVRPRLREVMNACGRALKGWLLAQLISMVLVGALVTVGLWLIGIPTPIALGLLAGISEFVPIVGPILSAVPGLLVAAVSGPEAFTLTLVLYIGVSQLEANIIMPLVQRSVASLPVVLGIFAVVAMGGLFGPLGILFATPAALVLYTAVTMLYRQDVLHDAEAVAPGQQQPPR
jgi:predicted PurR-regulated permease PerM